MASVLSEEDVRQAILWHALYDYDFVTIAQHFGVSVETLKEAIRNRVPGRVTLSLPD